MYNRLRLGFVALIFTAGSIVNAAPLGAILMTPPHPPAGTQFVLEFDYKTDYICPNLPTPYVYSTDLHIGVKVGSNCTRTATQSTHHVRVTVPPLPEGNYPVYGGLEIKSGFIPPMLGVIEGNISIGDHIFSDTFERP